MDQKYVYCELQHPGIYILPGDQKKLRCTVGLLDVRGDGGIETFFQSSYYNTVVIVMAVLICIAIAVFVVILILYRQGRIFKWPPNSELEMDKRALTPVGKAKEANRLLTHEIDATMTTPETEDDVNEGINSPEKVEEI